MSGHAIQGRVRTVWELEDGSAPPDVGTAFKVRRDLWMLSEGGDWIRTIKVVEYCDCDHEWRYAGHIGPGTTRSICLKCGIKLVVT